MLDPLRLATPLPVPCDDARLGRIVEEMPVGVFVADLAQGVFVLANARALELMGQAVAAGNSVEGLSALGFRSLDGRLLSTDGLPLARALGGEKPQEAEVRIRREDGTEKLARLGAAPLTDRGGRPLGAVGTCTDIASEIEDRAERDRSDRFREAFLGVLGHDLRFPLGTVTLTATTLLRNESDTAKRRALERIARNAGRMERMIEQLLDLTRLRVKQGIEVAASSTNLAEIVTSVVEGARAAAPDAAISLELSGDLGLLGDADRLEQVVDNLVTNAVQHGTKGKPILVRADGTDPAFVSLSVENEGVVPAETLAKLFQPFQVPSGSRAGRSGLGLGLWISRQIAAAHGGTVEVRSNTADGTRFTLCLPRRCPEAS